MTSISVAILFCGFPTSLPDAQWSQMSASNFFNSTVAGSKEVVTIHVIRIDHQSPSSSGKALNLC